MAIPTFDSVSLFTSAASDFVGTAQQRVYMEHMPGANGAYVQPHGYGARAIRARGVLSASSTTAALAMAGLKTAIRTKQAKADGGTTIAAYVGTDGHSYSNSMLQSYDQDGPIGVTGSGTSWTASCLCSAAVIQLVPA